MIGAVTAHLHIRAQPDTHIGAVGMAEQLAAIILG